MTSLRRRALSCFDLESVEKLESNQEELPSIEGEAQQRRKDQRTNSLVKLGRPLGGNAETHRALFRKGTLIAVPTLPCSKGMTEFELSLMNETRRVNTTEGNVDLGDQVSGHSCLISPGRCRLLPCSSRSCKWHPAPHIKSCTANQTSIWKAMIKFAFQDHCENARPLSDEPCTPQM